MSRRLQPPSRRRRAAYPAVDPQPPQWPSFQGQASLVGISPSGAVRVWDDPTLGNACLANAQDLLADADRIFTLNETIFGSQDGTVDVLVLALGGQTDGTGGADHMACDFVTGGAIEVCASFGQSSRVSSLFMAELSECAMGGNLCGCSTGEGLSRWCAAVTAENALADFATAPVWYADGMPNFVDSVDPTDQNADSTGCAMAFLSWLQSALGGAGLVAHTLPTIARKLVELGAGAPLCQLYAALTGAPAGEAWGKFSAAIQGLSGGVTTDDPFGAGFDAPAGGSAPAPGPGPAPAPASVTLAQAQAWSSQGLAERWPAS